jgi:hypothetical protein
MTPSYVAKTSGLFVRIELGHDSISAELEQSRFIFWDVK